MACLAMAVLLPAAAGAQAEAFVPADARPAIRPRIGAASLPPQRDSFGRPLGMPHPQTAAARAIDQAWKRDAAEASLKAWSEVLVKCQQATNPAWTSAIMRSEPQQAHCYRY
ncbi:hypothetical protein [Pseudoduganella sp.]|uniref:hypothetical protein n=1 Tax=Pseudoduganella sp. TaxID=1880898 RepID=UPI0035AEFFB4